MKRVFISYSHKDEGLRAELNTHLALLRRQGALDIWTDHCIRPGEDLNQSISEGLEQADIILLLVSADFLNSDYCYGIEMQRALEKHKNKECSVVPIILRPCDWKSAPFSGLKLLPRDGLPVTKWPSLDDAFLNIVEQLRTLLSEKHVRNISASSTGNQVLSSPPFEQGNQANRPVGRAARSGNLALPRVFTDQDKHDFTQAAFNYIRDFFAESLRELELRNNGISSRLSMVSPSGFTVVIFRDGKRAAGAYIRVGGAFSSTSIGYSGSEQVTENSYNEMLTIETDAHLMYLKPTLSFSRQSASKLTEEAAAEHLWSLFISPLQHR